MSLDSTLTVRNVYTLQKKAFGWFGFARQRVCVDWDEFDRILWQSKIIENNGDYYRFLSKCTVKADQVPSWENYQQKDLLYGVTGVIDDGQERYRAGRYIRIVEQNRRNGHSWFEFVKYRFDKKAGKHVLD